MKKILIIAPRFPSPLGKADSRTVFNLIKYFSKKNWEIDLICFYESKQDDIIYKDELKQYCKNIQITKINYIYSSLKSFFGIFLLRPLQVSYYNRKKIHKIIKRWLVNSDYDVVYSHMIRTSEYLKNITFNKPIIKVLGMQLSQTLNLSRMIKNDIKFFLKLRYYIEYSLVKSYERNIIKFFDLTLLTSSKDKEIIAPNSKSIFINPHGINIKYTDCKYKIPYSIAFTADMEVPTNINAIKFFYYSIFPTILKQFPDSKLFIIGRKPPHDIKALEKNNNVIVTGFVEDLTEYISRCEIAIDPLLIGAGMQNKILTCMSFNVPVVATSLANEGIMAKDGKEILLADNKDEFADKCIMLFNNHELRSEISNNAKKFINKYWTWEYHFKKLENILMSNNKNINQYIINGEFIDG